VRSSHGGTGDGVVLVSTTDPGSLDVNTGSVDINAGTVVGEISVTISDIRSSNSDSFSSGGRAVVASVLVIITSSNDGSDTSLDSSSNSEVNGFALTTSEGHTNDGLSTGNLLVFGNNVVDTTQDTSVRTTTLAVEDLDTVNSGLLSNTDGGTSNSGGNVSTMTVTIGILTIGSEVLFEDSTAFELNVLSIDTSINDPDINPLPVES